MSKRYKPWSKAVDRWKFKDSLELDCEEFTEETPDQGASLTGYFRNNELIKIKDWIGLSYGIMQHSFYFDNDQLIYVYETEDDFYIDDSSGTDLSRFDQHFRGDYYFGHNKLVDYVTLAISVLTLILTIPKRSF